MRVVRSTAVIRKSSCRGVGGVGVLRTIRPLSRLAEDALYDVCEVNHYTGLFCQTICRLSC